MESETQFRGLLIPIKKKIPIKQKILDSAQQIAYLSNQKAAVFYKDKYIVIDLNEQRNDKEQIFNISRRGQFDTTVGEQICFSVYNGTHRDSSYQLANLSGKTSNFQKYTDSFCHNDLIKFYCSNKVFLRRTAWTSISYVQLSHGSTPFNLGVDYNESQSYKKANDIDSIYINIKNSQRTIFNLVKRQKSTIFIPQIQNEKKGFISQLYLLSNQQAIYGYVKNHTCVIIGSLTLSKQGKYQHFIQFPDYELINFKIMNPNKFFVIFSISQYSNTELPKKPSKTIIFNYKNKTILFQCQSTMINPLGISPDLTHILQSIPQTQNSRYSAIVDYKLTDIKKVYMHLFKKSQLQNKYGKDLIRLILKVI